jgi:hypothetical protein
MKKRTVGLGNNQFAIPKSKQLDGSVVEKFPVVLNGGKTIIYISDKSKEEETRLKYELRTKEFHKYQR